MANIGIKRVYDPESPRDGRRILVERLWPRGIRKQDLRADSWEKEVAPSTELRKWYGHEVSRWPEFRRRYREELNENPDAWRPIRDAARKRKVTLLFSAHDVEHNSAVVLRDYLTKRTRRRKIGETGSVPVTPAQGRLATRGPFHLQATVRVLQRRPVNRVDVWDGNRYLRVLPVENGHVLAAVMNRGTVNRPDLHFALLAGEPRAAWRGTDGQFHQVGRSLSAILGLTVDPEPLHRAALSEPGLRPVATTLRGMRPPCFAGLFETFLNVIPFQQLSLDAGIAIIGRLVERFGRTLEYRGRRFHASPDRNAIAVARPAALRASGLSARKADTLRAIARAIASGTLDAGQIDGMPTDEALRHLMRLPGIGPWSAALVLLRGFRRLDVFPPGDVGAKRSLGRLLQVEEKSLYDRVRRFGDLRGYLYFLGLGGSLLRMGLIDAAGKEPAGFRR